MKKLHEITMILFLAILFPLNLAAELEDRLSSKWLVKSLNTAPFSEFTEHLAPNEHNPASIKRHLDLITKNGLLVSTGTERSFIALALCEKCTGLVGVDINPRVKAYNDFNTLLLKISRNIAEYLILRKVRATQNKIAIDIQQMVDTIKEKIINNTEMKKTEKEYYLSNLNNLANVFYLAQELPDMINFITPNNGLFEEANYLYNDKLFERLQRFARAGDIVFVIEDINRLRFLEKEHISAIDSSNIEQYVPLQFENDPKLTSDKVRVIWTATLNPTKFYSFIPVLKGEKMDRLIQDYKEKIMAKTGASPDIFDVMIKAHLSSGDGTDVPPSKSSAAHLLKVLEKIYN